MRILIIGGVAAGTSAAAKARRNNEDAEITIYDKDRYISYSGCGMPYYLGKRVHSLEDLSPRSPEFFKKKYNVDILVQHEVLSLDSKTKKLEVKNTGTGAVFSDSYDKLVLATGARSFVPPLTGVTRPHVFTLRNIVDMNKIMSYIIEQAPKKAVLIGTGFIGLEVAENLSDSGMGITLLEMMPQVAPGIDPEIAIYIEEHLRSKQVDIILQTGLAEIGDREIILMSGEKIEADIVILGTGVRPNVELAKQAGLEIGRFGGIMVDKSMRTSDPDIYACGDCIEQYHLLTNKPIYRPLGSTANKTGRIAGDCVTGGSLEFRGVLGTGICKVFDMTVAVTGLSEREAKENGYDVQVCHNIKPHKPEYLGGQDLVIKAVADRTTGRILGAQIVGVEGVDKRIDVFATAITFGARAEDLFHLDLAYAPPFSTTKDPVMYTGMILDNAMNRNRPLITADELDALLVTGENVTLIDTRVNSQFAEKHIENAVNIPHEKLRSTADTLDKNTVAVTYCNKGVTGNAAQNILLNKGIKKVFNISGGHKTFEKWTQLNK